jgi:predicted DNA-binding WGR domain protein
VARYADGKVGVEDVPVFEMAREWGRPGRAGAERLRRMTETPNHDALLTRLDAAEKARTRRDFGRNEATQNHAQTLAELRDLLPVVGAGAPLPETAFDGLSRFQLEEWRDACKRDAGDGQPGCVLVLDKFSPTQSGANGLLFLLNTRGRVDVLGMSQRSGRVYSTGNVLDETTGRKPALDAADLIRIQSGRFEIAPSSRKALWLDGVELIPDN